MKAPSRPFGRVALNYALVASIGSVAACRVDDAIIGDDTKDSGADVANVDASGDAAADVAADTTLDVPSVPDATPPDAKSDVPTIPDATPADVGCPSIVQPAPSFCDGGPIAAKYGSNGCLIGYACAPVACTAAGGKCVGLTPAACPGDNFGDITKYDCGGGIGVGCCLPK